jgi:coniferyl-aldehyde dehydrogenase
MPNHDMQTLLACQQRAFRKEGIPSANIRRGRINRAIALLIDNQQILCDAINVDFHGRSRHQSLMADIYGAIASLRYSEGRVSQWMKIENRQVQPPLGLLGAKAFIRYQPKGVVGAISTWNFPVWVPFGPLGGIFAAGNRCMIKLSEHSPHTSLLLEKLTEQYFDQEELVMVAGSIEAGETFSRLAFDHLLFTGASHVGKKIMHAAAENLVPVTLELGGKSPVVIGRNADLKKAASRLVVGKSLNAGQVCLSPDYIFVKENLLNDFIAELERAFAKHFPVMLHNPDYCSVIDQRNYNRLMNYLDDAKKKQGEIWEINPAKENFYNQTNSYKMPPALVINPSDDMLLMQEEIFGPILPIKGYHHIDEVTEYIVRHPAPLALYYFGNHQDELEKILANTISGGVTINDVIQHVGCEDLPFGGVSASGMGQYHGIEGFKTFSHARSIYKQSSFNLMALAGLEPPYSNKSTKVIERIIKQ